MTSIMNHYGWGLPVGASTYAKDIDFGLWLIHGAMLIIFVLWGWYFVYLLIRYRKKEGVAAQREETHASAGGVMKSLAPDLAVLVFEVLLIVAYAIPVWSRIKMSSPSGAGVSQIRLVAEQFAWNVHYPGADGVFGRRDPKWIHFGNPLGLDPRDPASRDDIVLANELHLAVNTPVVIELSSKDVVHSFFVPEFRAKQDIVPGMKTAVWVEPNRQGKYELACAQLCGFGHHLMRGDVFVHSPEEYQSWMKTQKTFGEMMAP